MGYASNSRLTQTRPTKASMQSGCQAHSQYTSHPLDSFVTRRSGERNVSFDFSHLLAHAPGHLMASNASLWWRATQIGSSTIKCGSRRASSKYIIYLRAQLYRAFFSFIVSLCFAYSRVAIIATYIIRSRGFFYIHIYTCIRDNARRRSRKVI